MQFLKVPGPVALTDYHTGADGEPVKEKHDDIDDHRCGADCRQGLRTHEITDDKSVHGIIEELENVSDQQRKRKKDHLRQDGTAGHVSGSRIWFLYMSVLHQKPFAFQSCGDNSSSVLCLPVYSSSIKGFCSQCRRIPSLSVWNCRRITC